MPERLMIDLSSNNAEPDMHKLYASGMRQLALKATEGTGYSWSRHGALADAWHAIARDTSVWHYHFARPGGADAQARKFLGAVKGHTRRGDRLVLDIEVTGVDGQFADAFWRVVDPASDLALEDYGSPSFLVANGVKPRHHEGLWLAEYGPKADIPAGWTHYDAWQFTDRASVPGEPGRVDESRVAVTDVAPAPQRNPFPEPPVPFDARAGHPHIADRVRWVQWALGRPTTGQLDQGDRQALLDFKRRHNLTVDLVIRRQAHDLLKAVRR